MSKDTDRLLGDAEEYDGIQEYDNPLPDWWVGLFWITILWAIGYSAHYHFIGNRSQEGALAAEMAAAELRWPEQARAQLDFAWSLEAAAGGEGVYAQNCAPCHAAGLEGLIGPSLIDEEWVHGGTPSDVIRVIREGVLDKGMVAWEGILSPEQINDVTAYILSKNAEATGRSIDDVVAEPEPTAGTESAGDAAADAAADAAGDAAADAAGGGG